MSTDQKRPWTYLTNHTHLLVVLSRDPDARIRDMAERVGITQRAVQRILGELIDAGVLLVEKRGRRNHYSVNLDHHLRHPLEQGHDLRELLSILG